jgi:hypothetical protein
MASVLMQGKSTTLGYEKKRLKCQPLKTIDKLGFANIKNFCASKDRIKSKLQLGSRL